MLKNENKEKLDLFDQLVKIWHGLKLLTYDACYEIYIGKKTGAMPSSLLWVVGIFLSLMFMFYLDTRALALLKVRSVPPGHCRDFLSITSMFWGFLLWGYYRLGARAQRNRKLNKAFVNSHLETRLKEHPQLISDFPIDDCTRKLRLRGRGIPVSAYVNAKDILENQLNIWIAKIENPPNNKEIVDIIYTTSELPAFWSLDGLTGYRDFSFPVGRGHRGPILANLKAIPHFLIAGESGGGKSSFIRMMITVLSANNADLEVYFLDFKDGMENQVFQGFDNIILVDNVQEALGKMMQLKDELDKRMRDFKTAKARSLEMYNKQQTRHQDQVRRIVVAVDEISELVPTIGGKSNSGLNEINSTLSRIARMGRAVGINLVIGTQKPDAKNLDPTIKANLSGILCFPVPHFSQSTVILGNARAADLNAAIPGRAIWKIGSKQEEVQTPFLTEIEVADARARAAKFWAVKDQAQAPAQHEKKETPKETHAG